MTASMLLWVAVLSSGPDVVIQPPVRIQCPAGQEPELRGDMVLCRPATAPAAAAKPPATASMELTGLHAVPEVCGAAGVSDADLERATETIHLAVSGCAEKSAAVAPASPTGWLVLTVAPGDKGRHRVLLPQDPWTAAAQRCLLAAPPRLPKSLAARTLSAWYPVALTDPAATRSPPCQPDLR